MSRHSAHPCSGRMGLAARTQIRHRRRTSGADVSARLDVLPRAQVGVERVVAVVEHRRFLAGGRAGASCAAWQGPGDEHGREEARRGPTQAQSARGTGRSP